MLVDVSTCLGGCYALLEPVQHRGDGNLELLVSRAIPSSLIGRQQGQLPRMTRLPAQASSRRGRSLPPGQLAGSTRRRRHWKRTACSRPGPARFRATWSRTRCAGGSWGRRGGTLASAGPSCSEEAEGNMASARAQGATQGSWWGDDGGAGVRGVAEAYFARSSRQGFECATRGRRQVAVGR